MAAKWDQDKMSVELAIQRELAYRRKLALQLKPYDDLLKDLIPLQHLISQKHQAKRQGLLDHPSPSTILSVAKRKEPSSIFQVPVVLKKQQNFNEDRMTESSQTDHRFHCKLCNVVCSSDFNLEQHMNGQRHQAKLQELANRQRRWCEVCKIPSMNEDLLKMQLEGRKHKAKVLELKNLNAAKGHGDSPADRQRWYCKLCRIWCIDEHTFKQHLEGKKHKFLVHDNFTKKRLPWQGT